MRQNFVRSSRQYLPGIVLTAGLVLTGLTAYFAHKNGSLTLDARFERLTEEIRTTIDSRIMTYQNALLQARGLIQLFPDIDRPKFKTYTDNMNIPVEYPGVMGLGYIQGVAPNMRAEVEKNLRAEYKNPHLGIWPKSASLGDESAYVIRFFEPEMAPVNGQSVLGYNIKVDPIRKAAYEHSLDSGQIVLSSPLHLIQDPSVDKVGYVLMVPVYRPGRLLESVAQRRQALIGFIYTAFRAQDLFEGIFPRDFLESFRISFDVHDPILGTNQPTLETQIFGYENLKTKLQASSGSLGQVSHQKIFHVQVGDRTFLIRAFSIDGFIPLATRILPWIILICGSLLSIVAYWILKKNQRQADQILKSERQMTLVTNALPVLISYVDDKCRYQFINQRHEDWFSLSREKFIGVSLKDALSTRNHQRIQPIAERALSGEAFTQEYQLELENGQTVPVRSSFIPDFGPRGEVKGFISLTADDSERKREEKNNLFLAELGAVLSASLDVETTLNRFAELLVPNLADWCVIDLVEDDGQCRHVAAVCADPHNAALIEKIKAHFPSDIASPYGPAEVIRSGEPILYSSIGDEDLDSIAGDPAKAELLRSLGLKSSMILPLKARNRVVGSVCLSLSNQSSSSDKLYTQDDVDFAMDVARRAALAVDNAQLYRAAQRASRAKDEFLATLSHELRTPMNVILGWLEIMENEHLDDETFQQALSTLNRNAHAQIQLINDLLDISRIISGKINLNVHPTNLATIAHAAIDGIRPAARNKNITLLASIPDQECVLPCDADRIQQILWNLLSNAVKFTPEGGRIQMTVEASKSTVCFIVEDSGQGIEPHFLPFVFDRFRQEDGSTTRSHGGLGLGLSIVRYLVELHGGRAEANSGGRGKGAKFTITFPRNIETGVARADASPAQPATVHNMTNAIEPRLNGVRVLLIDDSSDVRTLLSRILVRAGAQVITASRAQEGFEILRTETPDVILSDIGLPEEDGFSFMKRFRSWEVENSKPRIPAGALTAYAQESDSLQAFEAGYDCHIPKPVTAIELVRAVSSLAGRDGASSEMNVVVTETDSSRHAQIAE